MTLKEMRDYFKDFSGRDNLSDKRVDDLLNRAITFLSPKVVGHFGETYVFTGLSAGNEYVGRFCRNEFCEEIWYIQEDGAYIPLTSYLTLKEFLEENPSQDNAGVPAEWVKMPPMALAQLETVNTNFKESENWDSSYFDGHARLVLLFSATPSTDISLRLMGRRKILPLVEDSDYNILTRQEPLLLSLAALYHLEFFMRQYKEAGAIMKEIQVQLASLDTTSVEAEAEQLGDQIDG